MGYIRTFNNLKIGEKKLPQDIQLHIDFIGWDNYEAVFCIKTADGQRNISTTAKGTSEVEAVLNLLSLNKDCITAEFKSLVGDDGVENINWFKVDIHTTEGDNNLVIIDREEILLGVNRKLDIYEDQINASRKIFLSLED